VTRLVVRLLCIACAFSATDALAAPPRGATRILYASDWIGTTQIFAVDPTHRKPLAQITFERPERCSAWLYPITCGFYDPIPSHDGRHIAFRSTGTQSELWIADADGRNAHIVATNLLGDPGVPYAAWSPDSRRLAYAADDGYHLVRADGSTAVGNAGNLYARWRLRQRELLVGYSESVSSPDRRWIAFADKRGVGVTNRRTKRTRVLATEAGFSLSWSPDSKSLAYVSGFLHSGTSSTHDLRVVTLVGKTRTVVAADSRYGGRIVSTAWTRPPSKAGYQAPVTVDGLYAGGEVARLAAEGSQIAFAACNSVFLWSRPAPKAFVIDPNPLGDTLCFPPTDRVQVYDLVVARGGVAFGRTEGGLTPRMELTLEFFNPTLQRRVLAQGGTVVGGHQHGIGTLAASGAVLLYSSWDGFGFGSPNGDAIVTSQIIFRVVSSTCPCPAIASSPGLVEPLDVDDGRILVSHVFWPDGTWASRRPSLAVLDATGTELLSLPTDAAAAQLSGRDLAVLVRGHVLDYDAATGRLVHAWPIPDVSVGRDCMFWSGPDCPGFRETPRLVLQDASRGFAAYTLDGRVHVLRLSDGDDPAVGYGSKARFTDTGLAYADGARIHVAPFRSLARR
jgi:Tol biopolymer transport system component